jgi:hypothetical protein
MGCHSDYVRTLAIAKHSREHRDEFMKKVRKSDKTGGRTLRRNALMHVAREHFYNLSKVEQELIIASVTQDDFRCSGVGAKDSTDVDMDASGSAPGIPEVAAFARVPEVAASARIPEVAACARANPSGDTSLAVATPRAIRRRAIGKTRASSSFTFRCFGAKDSTDVDMDASGSAPGIPEVAASARIPEVAASARAPEVAASARIPEGAASAMANPSGDTSLAVATPRAIRRRAIGRTRASSSSTFRCSGVGAKDPTDVDMDASGSAPGLAKDVAATQARRMEQMILVQVRKLQDVCKGDLAFALDIISASVRFLGLYGGRVWEFGRCRNDYRAMLVKVAVVLGIGAKLTTATDGLVAQVWRCVVPSSLVPRVRELELLAVNVCGVDAMRPSRVSR